MRLQLALNVADLDEAVDFYTRMFGVAPAKTQPGYANFAIDQPPLKLVLFEGGGESGSINHLGVETETAAEVVAAEARLGEAGWRRPASTTRCVATPRRPRRGSTDPTAPAGSGTSRGPTSSRSSTSSSATTATDRAPRAAPREVIDQLHQSPTLTQLR